MNETELVKEMINRTGLSMRAFSILADIPYTTLRSMLDKNIGHASVNTVLKVCSALNITIEELFEMSTSSINESDQSDIIDISSHINEHDLNKNNHHWNFSLTSNEAKLLKYFNSLNDIGKKEVLKRISEMNFIPKYAEQLEESNNDTITNSTENENTEDINSNSNNYNNDHIGMAAHNDYATDPDELALIHKDLENLSKS